MGGGGVGAVLDLALASSAELTMAKSILGARRNAIARSRCEAESEESDQNGNRVTTTTTVLNHLRDGPAYKALGPLLTPPPQRLAFAPFAPSVPLSAVIRHESPLAPEL